MSYFHRLGAQVSRTSAAAGPVGPGQMTERQVTLALIDELTERALAALSSVDDLGGLPHPLITTRNLGWHMVRATARSDELTSRADRLPSALGQAAHRQSELNESLIHALHQLDHRSGRAERRVVELEARVAELERQLAAGTAGMVGDGSEVERGGSRRAAVLYAHHGVNGGFERHLARVVAQLRDSGWAVEVIGLDATRARPTLFGLPIEAVQHEFHDDYFAYLSLVAQVVELDLSRFDVVLTTQPPTYLARHDRKVGLFYHQARQFYDLADFYTASGFAEASIHHAASASVRAIDQAGRRGVRQWLAGSSTSADRLGRFWAVDDAEISLHRAPPACSLPDQSVPYTPEGPIVHVGRMEWPKRPELVVEALHLLRTPHPASFVGGGSRRAFVESLDARLGANPELAGTLPEAETWLNRGIFTAGWRPSEGAPSGRIEFVGPVDDRQRDTFYRSASVVVIPAHNEDYGLTALEAMAFARPVVVCRDGGGLTELVDDGSTGLVVEPTASAIAGAIDRLLADPDWAAALGRAGQAAVQALDGDQEVAVIGETMEKVLSS